MTLETKGRRPAAHASLGMMRKTRLGNKARCWRQSYRITLLISNRSPTGPYHRPMPRALQRSWPKSRSKLKSQKLILNQNRNFFSRYFFS